MLYLLSFPEFVMNVKFTGISFVTSFLLKSFISLFAFTVIRFYSGLKP